MNTLQKVICPKCGGIVMSASGNIVFVCPHCNMSIQNDSEGSVSADSPSERSALNLYNLVDFNRNGSLDSKELQSALQYGGLQFTLPTVNILLAKHDRNRNGQIEFNEFKSLLDEVWKWKDAFDYFDTDKSGSIDFHELQKTLSQIGITLSPTTFQTVFFSSDTDRSGTISIDEFIKLVTELQISQIKFNSLTHNEHGRVELSYDDFVNLLFSIRN